MLQQPGERCDRATLAQLVERLIRNQQVAGSIPAGGSIFQLAITPAKLDSIGFRIESAGELRAAKRLALDACDAMFGLPYGDISMYESYERWTPWFRGKVREEKFWRIVSGESPALNE